MALSAEGVFRYRQVLEHEFSAGNLILSDTPNILRSDNVIVPLHPKIQKFLSGIITISKQAHHTYLQVFLKILVMNTQMTNTTISNKLKKTLYFASYNINAICNWLQYIIIYYDTQIKKRLPKTKHNFFINIKTILPIITH